MLGWWVVVFGSHTVAFGVGAGVAVLVHYWRKHRARSS